MSELYPLRFHPVYKDYIWGNNRLPFLFGREAPAGIYAESWEVSTHPDGESVITNGPYAGKRFSEVLDDSHVEMLGTDAQGSGFPLLIKLIDAALPLSVQVHPNHMNAEAVQGDPKTEMWYFLNEEPSRVYCGLKPGTTREALVEAMADGSAGELLRTVPAVKGGAVFVPGGRVHAIDAGCLILEIQQSSNTTYRMYDWGRVGADGKPRELHEEKALQVIDFEDASDPLCVPQEIEPGLRLICRSPFFVLEELSADLTLSAETDGRTFHLLFCSEHGFDLLYGADQKESVARGECVLLPAALGAYQVDARGAGPLLRISLPD